MYHQSRLQPYNTTKEKSKMMFERRSFLSYSLAAAGSLALAGCTGGLDTTGVGDEASTSADDATLEPGTIRNGVLVSPYDEGYDSGLHHARIEVADFGTIEVEVNATNTPITVSNFAHLANEGFYDGLTFHRIISGFMVQGGDPNGNGTGGSDVKIKGEFSANGIPNAIRHKRGVISMARSNDYDSASSQFFIMHEDSSSLDTQYAAFGKVTSGLEVVDALAQVEVEDSNGTVAVQNQPVITSIAMID